MKIPEAHICDAQGCMKDAWYRITHEILREPTIAGHMRYGLDWNRCRPMVFEFCDEHATDFSIGGRGAWTTPPRLKPGVPEGI